MTPCCLIDICRRPEKFSVSDIGRGTIGPSGTLLNSTVLWKMEEILLRDNDDDDDDCETSPKSWSFLRKSCTLWVRIKTIAVRST